MSFAEKVVLITDGSSDIGATTAVAFAKEGASVAIVGKTEDKLKQVAQRCEELGATTLTIKADVSKDAEADLIVEKTIDKFGKLDVLVNNAGIYKEASILSDDFLQTYDELMNVMRGAIRITYFAVPHLIKSKGNIVNVSSVPGINTTATLAYRTSKAAMSDFTKTVALELSLHEVTVKSINPDPDQETVFNSLKENVKINDTALKKLEVYLKSIGTAGQKLSDPNKIADMILYESSDKVKDVTGSSFWLKLNMASDRKRHGYLRDTVNNEI